ncbi:hypothetical protein EIN_150510 [Entamoeba invadens IP1]|uniref:Uncharacterized protein n=1 Tax=Entamoeba invadens IP1 TaxID=370355 RepID=A0A0A1U8E6_ENTIV|nr:hypothetical protein EIN_150510 [Entamoeba invadens IP1]ELP91184.1 hypothetical protein EIN_150510 [Entamoeba invadens IP1]|eukprot:XP_004257955.1 hypothetical protein EIN_150510 [Entamoeba invadens IP1]
MCFLLILFLVSLQNSSRLTKFQINYVHLKHFSNEYIDTSRFNYTDICGDIFKYNANSEKDYLIGSYEFYDKCCSPQFLESLEMARVAMPNCHIVIIFFSELPKRCKNDYRKLISLKIEFVKVTKKETDYAVIARFISYLDFVSTNYNKIDRIFLMDIRIVLFYSDFFQTFSNDEISWLSECYGTKIPEQCFGPSNFPDHAKWLSNFISKENSFIKWWVCFWWGSKNEKKTLEIINAHIDKSKMKWGYDQALINWLFYNGKFKEVDMKSVLCEQR